jgi:Xaa-Pro aminopeptidase
MSGRQPRILRALGLVVLVVAAWAAPAAGPLFTDVLPAEEFAAHRSALIARLGDGVAILQGASERPAFLPFRQTNHFFYLSGVESPRAFLAIDGASKTTTLFLQPVNERHERSEGPVLTPGPEAVRLTGISDVRVADELAAFVASLGTRTVYTPFRMGSLGAYTPDRIGAHARASEADPWDGRAARETAAFREKLQAKAPGIQIRDLDPILDELRLIKTPREVALIRQATRIAGDAIMEAMRSVSPGMREYELEAIGDYFFRRAGAQGPAYFGLIASGQNAFYPHYHSGRSVLKDGDLVLFDYAPDFHYYTSDVTRQFPVNGRFTPDQRELYGVYVKLYEALMQSIRPRAAPADILRDAAGRMDRVLASFTFRQAKYREAAERFVQGFRKPRGSLGHMVGMEVHDVTVKYDRLEPGMVFTIEPVLTVPDERIYIRLEDPILVTETGYENLSAFVPIEIDAVEKLMAEPGMFELTPQRQTPPHRAAPPEG